MIGLLLGIFGHAWSAGFSGLAIGASGACVGLLCFLPFYNSGGMGAGDVKLMAMCGAFLGPAHVITAAAATLFVGGIFGIAWAFWQRVSATDDLPGQGELASGIPYAFAIAVGTCISLIVAPAITNIIK
jgi:prepilin peptidase CpaA